MAPEQIPAAQQHLDTVDAEWKPGDVARTSSGGTVFRSSRPGKDAWILFDGFAVDLGYEPRPLVVIDPDDAEQVTALANAWDALHDKHAALTYVPMTLSALRMQSALREFARSTPRIEEPGFPSIVTDGDGEHWANHANGSWTCLNSAPGVDRPRTWDTLVTDYGPISILSPGVTP